MRLIFSLKMSICQTEVLISSDRSEDTEPFTKGRHPPVSAVISDASVEPKEHLFDGRFDIYCLLGYKLTLHLTLRIAVHIVFTGCS